MHREFKEKSKGKRNLIYSNAQSALAPAAPPVCPLALQECEPHTAARVLLPLSLQVPSPAVRPGPGFSIWEVRVLGFPLTLSVWLGPLLLPT